MSRKVVISVDGADGTRRLLAVARQLIRGGELVLATRRAADGALRPEGRLVIDADTPHPLLGGEPRPAIGGPRPARVAKPPRAPR